MGEKIFIIILKVDLDCRKCYKKISKTICMLQERESIQTVKYDEKNNTVTISGPFDPKKLCKKLCCKASKVIKDIQIKEETPKKDKDNDKDKDKDNDKDKDKQNGEKLQLGPPEPGPDCSCGCRPWYWYGGYYGDYKCPWCGRWYGWAPECPPRPPVIYVAPPPQTQPCGGYKTCTFICEEDPQSSCSIM